MNKALFFLLWILCFGQLYAQNSDFRNLLVQSGSEEGAEAFFDFTQNQNIQGPLAKGYKGFAQVTMAEYKFNPFTQFSYFNKGTDLLEEALSEDPKNGELAMLRFTLQIYCPSFLGYNDNLDEDFERVVEIIKDQGARENTFWSHVLSMLLAGDHISDSQIKELKNIKTVIDK